MLTYDVYVDGSFNGSNASWGFIVVENDKPIHSDKGVLFGQINEMYQVGGEITAAMKAIEWAKTNSCKINIFYDYLGIENWATKQWKAKKKFTQEYQKFMQDNKSYINSFKKVKSHSGNTYNEAVDQLAASATTNSISEVKESPLIDKPSFGFIPTPKSKPTKEELISACENLLNLLKKT